MFHNNSARVEILKKTVKLSELSKIKYRKKFAKKNVYFYLVFTLALHK